MNDSNVKRFSGKLIDKSLLSKNENGNTLCRWCNNPVLPPRRTMCSDECAHEIKLRANSRYLRRCVFKRDKGICAICSIDTKNIAKEALQINLIQDKELQLEYLKKHNISSKRKIHRRKLGGGLWDADHIVAVKNGGGQCGLDNLRTLCISCHKNVTKDSYKI